MTAHGKGWQARPAGGLGRLFRDMEHKPCPFDVVVVVDLDRVTRSEDLRERARSLALSSRAQVKLAVSSTGQVLDLNSSSETCKQCSARSSPLKKTGSGESAPCAASSKRSETTASLQDQRRLV